ncbi:hypothetical protein WJX77_000267 [Trebouxia sp. C0004]
MLSTLEISLTSTLTQSNLTVRPQVLTRRTAALMACGTSLQNKSRTRSQRQQRGQRVKLPLAARGSGGGAG